MTRMTKGDLQEQLDARGVKYDKRWGIAKLQALLDEAAKPKVKREDTPEVPAPVDNEQEEDASTDESEPDSAEPDSSSPQLTEENKQAEQSPQITPEESQKNVQELRENAKIAREIYRKKVNSAENNRAKKLGRRTYTKRVLEGAVEIYEKETGKYIRTYSQSVHGEEYAALADKFIDTRKNVMDAPVKIRYKAGLIV